jgi:uncharacterized membrane protein
MPERSDAVSDYLERLAECLEALGPAETSEVLSEIYSLLAEAIQDNGGDERGAIAKLGLPEDLATQILEERGILRDGSPVPKAPTRLRIAALVIDVAVWLVACMLLVPVIGVIVYATTSRFAGGAGFSINAIAILLMIVAAAALGWLWFGRRRRRWYVSTGMEVFGLRTIRLGRETRVVRIQGIPGAIQGKWSRAGSIASAAIVLSILVVGLFSLVSSAIGNRAGDRETAALNAVSYSGTGVQMVSEIYREAGLGTAESELSGWFAPGSESALKDLLARQRGRQIVSYSISSIDLTGADLGGFSQTSVPDQAGVLVTMSEFPEGSAQPAAYRYLVKLIVTSRTSNSFSGEWLIQSVDRVS